MLWGVAFAILVRGLPVDADNQIEPVVRRRAQPVHAAGRVGDLRPVPFHGAVFIALKTTGAVRDDAIRFAGGWSLAGHGRGRPAFGVWTQLAHGKDWTWVVLGVAVVAPAGGRRDAGAVRGEVTAGRSVAPHVVVAAVVDPAVRRPCTRTWCRRR